MDRSERQGLGVAVAGHVLLFAALGLTLPDAPEPPAPPPAVEVEFVDGAEVALTAQAPPAAATAPAPAPEMIEPAEPEPVPVPTIAPVPEPRPAPPSPAPVATPRPAPRPQPRVVERSRSQPKPAVTKIAPKQAAAPQSRLGADFLKGIGSDPKPEAEAAGATLTAASLAGIQQVIANRIQPCANRQISPGPGANAIRTSLRLRLKPDGSLAAAPAVVSQSGVGDENGRFADRVADLAVAAVRQCAPLKGLPAALYKTPKGGWSDIRFSYKLPG